MGKKKNAPAAAAAGTSLSNEIHDLKSLNSEVTEFRKQIEHLRSQLDSLTADRDIPDSIERDVFRLALPSTLGEAEARSNAQIAEATYKVESATADATQMRLLPLLREQDAVVASLKVT